MSTRPHIHITKQLKKYDNAILGDDEQLGVITCLQQLSEQNKRITQELDRLRRRLMEASLGDSQIGQES